MFLVLNHEINAESDVGERRWRSKGMKLVDWDLLTSLSRIFGFAGSSLRGARILDESRAGFDVYGKCSSKV